MTPNDHPIDLSAQQRAVADEANRKMRENWEEMQKKATPPLPGHAMGVLAGGHDPWKHRSTGMQCNTCMWFIKKEGAVHGLGRCRRHAPTMNGYPAVFVDDWCGDHKLDENKVGK